MQETDKRRPGNGGRPLDPDCRDPHNQLTDDELAELYRLHEQVAVHHPHGQPTEEELARLHELAAKTEPRPYERCPHCGAASLYISGNYLALDLNGRPFEDGGLQADSLELHCGDCGAQVDDEGSGRERATLERATRGLMGGPKGRAE